MPEGNLLAEHLDLSSNQVVLPGGIAMSRCRESLLAVSMLILLQTPMMARPSVHQMHTAKNPAPAIKAPGSAESIPSTAKAPASTTKAAASTDLDGTKKAADSDTPMIQTQPAVIRLDDTDFKAPQGALYTTSDECG